MKDFLLNFEFLTENKDADMDESEFTYKIAQAAMDGKKTVKIGDKELPVKMSKDQAKKILDSDEEDEKVKESTDFEIEDILNESMNQILRDVLEEKKKKPKDKDHPGAYKAPAGSQRDKDLDRASAAYARGDKSLAISIRDDMEKKAREKPGFKPKKSRYTDADMQEESPLDEELNLILGDVLEEGGLNAKTRAALKKKAESSNAPLGALTAVYRKGLGAFYSSGSRPGMGAHQWAMARVNSFLKGGKARNVDKSQWAQVQKHRKKKKK